MARLVELHPKLDFLLKGHGVDFDASGLDLDTLTSVDAKVSAITEAHGGPHDDDEEAGGRR